MAFSVSPKTGGTLDATNKTYSTITVSKNYLYRYKVKFNYTGLAKFYSEGNHSVIGYLTTTTSYSSSEGAPSGTDLSMNSYVHSEGNFTFYYPVVTGQIYYVWMRSEDETTSGKSTLHIDYIPTAEEKIEISGTSTPYSSEIELSDNALYKYEVSFTTEGFIVCNTEGNLITDGYLTNTSLRKLEYDYGDNNGDDKNFRIRYHVEADTPYYLWVRTGSQGQNYTEIETATKLHIAHIPRINDRLNDMSDNYVQELEISGDKVYRYRLTFQEDGYATIFTEGNVGVDGYLVKGDYEGYYLMSDDNTSTNLSIICKVYKDNTYYLWVMGGTLWKNGTTTLTIIPPGSRLVIDETVSGLDKSYLSEYTPTTNIYYRYNMTFPQSGVVDFKTIGTSKVDCYLTKDSSDNYPPEVFLQQDHSAINFSQNVIKDTPYYLWIESYNIGRHNPNQLLIVPPSKVNELDLETIKDDTSFSLDLNYGDTAYCYQVKFARSEQITFSTSGNLSTDGYLTTTNAFDGRVPTGTIKKSSVGTGKNFSFTYNVTAGTTYYLWVINSDLTQSGTTTLNIDCPLYAEAGDSFGLVTENKEIDIPISSKRIHYHEVVFKYGGRVRISLDSENLKRVMYLTTSNTLDQGIPKDIVCSANGQMEYQVAAGTTYYLWVKGSANTDDKEIMLSIQPPPKPILVNVGNIEKKHSIECSFLCDIWNRYEMTFANSGYADFYTTTSILGDSTTVGYLTSNPSDIYPPEDYLKRDTKKVDFSYQVTKDTPYYLWTTGGSFDEKGSLNILPPSMVNTQDLGTIEGDTSLSLDLSYTDIVYCFKVKFKKSRSVNFFTKGNIATNGYLTTTTSFDGRIPTGTYKNSDVNSTNTKRNFNFFFDVVAGTTYYLWVVNHNSELAGTTTLKIDCQPYKEAGTSFGTIELDKSFDVKVSSDRTYYHKVVFSHSGSVIIDWEDDNNKRYMYLTTSTSFTDGAPGNSEGSDLVDWSASIRCDVTAGKTYYLWVEGIEGDNDNTMTLFIDAPFFAKAGTSFGTIELSTYIDVAMSNDCVYYHKVIFSHSGIVRIDSMDSAGRDIYLTTSTSFTNGLPGKEDGSDIIDAYSSIECEITANKTYYVWVMPIEGSEDAPMTLFINPPTFVKTGTGATYISNEIIRTTDMSNDFWYRYKIMFEHDGTATFYIDGEIDNTFFLTTDDDYDTEIEEPSGNVLTWDYNYMQYTVFGGTYYYLWVKKTHNEDPLISTTLHIIPPWICWDETSKLSSTTIGKHYTLQLEPYTLYRFKLQFKQDYNATFFTEGNIDTVGYLCPILDENETFKEGELEDWQLDEREYWTETGEPTYTYADNDDIWFIDNNDDEENDVDIEYKNFQFTSSVEEYDSDDPDGTSYYLYVRAKHGNQTGTTDLYIRYETRIIDKDLGTLSGGMSLTFPALWRTIHCYKVVFNYTGKVNFYVPNGNVVGYLCSNDDFSYDVDSETLIPEKILAESEYDYFYFTYRVTKGTTYYIQMVGDDWDPVTLRIVPSIDEFNLPYQESNLKKGSVTTQFRYTTWNDLVNKVAETHKAVTGYQWNNYYATYEQTLMTETDKVLTAKRYNSLKYQIGYLYETGIDEVSKGDIVNYQTHFLYLINRLNEWIYDLNNGIW